MFARHAFPVVAILCLSLATSVGYETSDEIDRLDVVLTPLERKIALKLRTAVRVRENLGKILGRLPWRSYELHRSIELVAEYLRSGGSLLDCLEDLPALAFAPFDRQFAGMMASMEDHLPRYLVPAISALSRSIHAGADGLVDANEIYRPDFGPLRADLFEGVSLQELREAGLPHSRAGVGGNVAGGGAWPAILSDACAMIASRTIAPRAAILAHLLDNLRVPSSRPATRRSAKRVVRALLELDGGRRKIEARPSNDPYEFARNVLLSLERMSPEKNASLLVDVSSLRDRLRNPTIAECPRVSELQGILADGAVNYTRLVATDEELRRSKAAGTLLYLLERGKIKPSEPFYPLEHVTRSDLLLALASKLRRERPTSDALDAVYGSLLIRSPRKRWRFFRNGRTARTVLRALAGRREKPRLYEEVAARLEDRDDSSPSIWRRAAVYAGDQSETIAGPLDATVKALRALLGSGAMPSRAVTSLELLLEEESKLEKTRATCLDRLASVFVADEKRMSTSVVEETTKRLDVPDLLQAIPDLDLYSDEYRELEGFLSRDSLESDLRVRIRPSLVEYPTRGRLLSWLLSVVEGSSSVSAKIRKLAGDLADSVAYEGYGASPVLLRSS